MHSSNFVSLYPQVGVKGMSSNNTNRLIFHSYFVFKWGKHPVSKSACMCIHILICDTCYTRQNYHRKGDPSKVQVQVLFIWPLGRNSKSMMHISYFSQKSTLRIPGHETYRLTGVIIFSSICRHYTACIRSTKDSKQRFSVDDTRVYRLY